MLYADALETGKFTRHRTLLQNTDAIAKMFGLLWIEDKLVVSYRMCYTIANDEWKLTRFTVSWSWVRRSGIFELIQWNSNPLMRKDRPKGFIVGRVKMLCSQTNERWMSNVRRLVEWFDIWRLAIHSCCKQKSGAWALSVLPSTSVTVDKPKLVQTEWQTTV